MRYSRRWHLVAWRSRKVSPVPHSFTGVFLGNGRRVNGEMLRKDNVKIHVCKVRPVGALGEVWHLAAVGRVAE